MNLENLLENETWKQMMIVQKITVFEIEPRLSWTICRVPINYNFNENFL